MTKLMGSEERVSVPEPIEMEYTVLPRDKTSVCRGRTLSTGLAARLYRRSGTQATILRSTAPRLLGCSACVDSWGFKPRGDCFDFGVQISQPRLDGLTGLCFRQRGRRIEWTLGSLWIQPRDRRAVQMSAERGIPAFSGRVDGAIGNARL